jgi:hypothetical protein
VENKPYKPYPLFSNITDATTMFQCKGIRDPYADKLNENWPLLKNNFDKAQFKLIVEKKIIGNNLIGWEHFKQYVNDIVDIHAHQHGALEMSTPDLLPVMIRKNKDLKKLIKKVSKKSLFFCHLPVDKISPTELGSERLVRHCRRTI